MLDINTSSADFFKQDGEVRISLFANIPYDNIKELFGNFHPEKK
jgi:hypothetical protein